MDVGKQAWFVSKKFGEGTGAVGEAGSASSDKVCNFYPHLTLKNNISTT